MPESAQLGQVTGSSIDGKLVYNSLIMRSALVVAAGFWRSFVWDLHNFYFNFSISPIVGRWVFHPLHHWIRLARRVNQLNITLHVHPQTLGVISSWAPLRLSVRRGIAPGPVGPDRGWITTISSLQFCSSAPCPEHDHFVDVHPMVEDSELRSQISPAVPVI